jgi:hypothetical protein
MIRRTDSLLLPIVVLLSVSVAAAQGLSPSSVMFTVAPGGSITEPKTINVPAKPPKADIEIAIDTTGSMGPSIAQAKADAVAIVTGVQGAVPDTQFAVVQFRDAGDSPEYQVVQSMTANATAVQNAVNGLSPDGGGDAPEAYNLVFQNSYTPDTGGDIGWRSGTRKFVIVLGDAQPHGDLANQGLAGCSNTSPDPHGLVTKNLLAGMNAGQRTLILILQTSSASTTLTCYQSLAAGGYTGGQGVPGGSSLAGQIVALINAAFATVGNVHLEVASASPAPANASWISFNPASFSSVPAPSSLSDLLTATVPLGTPGGTYTFDIVALADAVDIGHQKLVIKVNSPPSCANLALSLTTLWPPNHKLITVTASGATDPDGDPVTLVIAGVTQDEPTNGLGDGDESPDAVLSGGSTVQLRAERSGPANGRVYHLRITATDPFGASCTVDRTVSVPHDQAHAAIDSAPPSYDSTLP